MFDELFMCGHACENPECGHVLNGSGSSHDIDNRVKEDTADCVDIVERLEANQDTALQGPLVDELPALTRTAQGGSRHDEHAEGASLMSKPGQLLETIRAIRCVSKIWPEFSKAELMELETDELRELESEAKSELDGIEKMSGVGSRR